MGDHVYRVVLRVRRVLVARSPSCQLVIRSEGYPSSCRKSGDLSPIHWDLVAVSPTTFPAVRGHGHSSPPLPRGAMLKVPGAGDVHMCMTGCFIPPGEQWAPICERCSRAQSDPNSLDVSAIEKETGTCVLLLRTTARLFVLVLVDVADAASYSLYEDFLFNIANVGAMALDAQRGQIELRAWPERGPITNAPDRYARPGVAELTPRPWEVLTQLLNGERVPRIAEGLFLSQSTVRNHLADIFKKLGVHSQEELLDLFRGARGE